jgi:hypothetical protein
LLKPRSTDAGQPIALDLTSSWRWYEELPQWSPAGRRRLTKEMEISLVPMLLGAAERLFEGIRELGGLRLVQTVAAPNVTHLKFARA